MKYVFDNVKSVLERSISFLDLTEDDKYGYVERCRKEKISMKIKYILLNLFALFLWITHSILGKYDIVHYMISTYFALFLIGISPIIFSVINSCVSKHIHHFIILNLFFTLCQLAGLCAYDVIIVGSLSDSVSLLAGPTVIYIAVITSIILLIKLLKKKLSK